jgi:hypothetical protein
LCGFDGGQPVRGEGSGGGGEEAAAVERGHEMRVQEEG